jgi:hypothetical protein
MHNFYREFPITLMLLDLAQEQIFVPHQDDFHIQVSGGPDGAFDLGPGGVVSAHCIYGNGEHVRSRLFLFDFHHFSSLVLAAVGADAVRQFGFVAIGTLGKAGRFQRIVGAAIIRAPLRMSSFRVRHISSLQFKQSFPQFRD